MPTLLNQALGFVNATKDPFAVQ